MDTEKQQVPMWFWATGIIAMSLLITGIVVGPNGEMNEWKLAAGLVGMAGISTLLIKAKLKKEK
jgi:cytochrome b subunit of formate dehydrogenase